MIYLDTSNTWFLRECFTTGLLECVPQDEAAAGGDWEPFEGTREEFFPLVRCTAPLHRIPAHLREDI